MLDSENSKYIGCVGDETFDLRVACLSGKYRVLPQQASYVSVVFYRNALVQASC